MKDLEKYKDVNVIYNTFDMFEVLKNIYKVYNYQVSEKNIKLSGTAVIMIYFEKFNMYLHADVNYDEERNINYKDIMQVCTNVGIPFNNQLLSSIMLDYEKKFFDLKKERVKLSDVEMKIMLEQADNQCENEDCQNICLNGDKKKFRARKDYQYDHIIPLSGGGTNTTDNIQILCIACHHEKTQREKESSQHIFINPTESSFNSIGKEIIESDLSKSWAFVEAVSEETDDMKKNQFLNHIDINKTRRNILLYNEYDLPVYTVMDKPEAFLENDDIVVGMYYVETKSYMPMRGNGWYMMNTINYCLAEGRITKQDIKYKFLPSLTAPKDHFKEFINSVVEKFGDKFNKLGPNSFIGCFNKKETQKHKLSLTTSKEDAQDNFYSNGGNHVFYDEDLKLWATYTMVNISFEETRTPIYKYILEQEAIEMDKLKNLVVSRGGKIIHFNTDCISCYFNKPQAFDKIIENTLFGQAGALATAGNNALRMDGVKKYKYEQKEKPAYFERKSNYVRFQSFECNILKWNEYKDVEDNDFKTLVDLIMNSNKSFHIDGPAGTGKSTLIKMIMESIKKNNKRFVGLAPTNKACRIINGQTIHKFLACSFSNRSALKNKLMGVDYIIVDEVSMVQELFYKVFLSIKRMYPAIKFIMVGDFRQLAPVKDRVEDIDYKNSPALFELCDSNKLMLSKCRRSDDVLYNLCKEENISKVKAEDFGKVFTTRHLCYTNIKRKAVNQICMKNFIKAETNRAKQSEKKIPTPIKCKKLDYDDNSQDVELLKGMPIIARVNNKELDIQNNQTYYISKVNDDIVEFGDKVIDPKDFNKYFNVAFAMTIHKSQGSTFDYPYTIHEWEMLDDALKYVALSRATDIKKINIL